MKKITYNSTVFLLVLFWGITINSSGQTTIWSEDFSAYVENTGIEGPGVVNIGDYPANVTKWTLDVSGCTLSDADDYLKTHNYAKELEGRDLDGSAIWQSESIDISSYSVVTFSLDASEDGSLNSSDYFDVYYQVDGGDFTRIPNWNGMGNDYHTLVDDFPSTTITQTISSGNQLVIKVVMHNNSMWDRHYLDDIFVKANMEYVSSTTTQNARNIAAGKTNRQIVGVEVVTTGTESPISITQFTINANGSSTPVSTNIENAKIYYTATDNTFATGTQFGSTFTSPTTANFDITGTQQLSEGTNYFWLTFDTKTGATVGELIDAECISFVISGSTETPTITAPAGSRTIAAPLSGSYTIGAKSNYASFTAAANDLNDLGISSTVSFAVASGTYTEQISLSAIDGTSATDTIVFQSSTGNRADVTLQFTPTSSANYVLNFDGTDHISFLDMTIQTTGTSSYGKVFVFKGTIQNITLKNNNIIGKDVNSDNDNYIVIFGEGGTSNLATNINIENDTIRYGSKAIYFEGGNENNLETGNTFINNVIEDFYHIGMNIWYQDAVIINQNRITSKGINTAELGIYAYYCSNDIEITQNRVLLSAADENTGIELYDCYGTTALPGLIANNFVSITVASLTTAGINIVNTGHQNIYHNSINSHSAKKGNKASRTGTQAGMGITHHWADVLHEGLKIINNIVSGTLTGIDVSQTTADNGYLESSDNNDWFTLNNILGSWGSIDCPDLAAWQAASGLDGSSVSVDPLYGDNNSALIGNSDLNSSVPKQQDRDLFNAFRGNTTAPGASDKTRNKWLGTQSSNPDDPNNWSKGEVPGPGDNVYIGKGDPYNVQLNGDTEWNDVQLNSELENNSAAIDLGGHTLTITGNFVSNHGYVTNGTLNFTSNENQNYESNSPDQPGHYFDVHINKGDGSTFKVWNQFIPSDLILGSGGLDANGNKIEVNGNADLSGGSVTNTSTVELTGTGTIQFNPGNNTLNNVKFTGGGTYDVLAKLAVEGDFLASGTVNFNGHDQEFGGNVDLSNCNYNHGNGKFIVNNDEGPDIWTGMASFFFMQFNSITFNGKTTRIYTPNDAQVIITELINVVTSSILKNKSVTDTIKFFGNVQCNQDFTIGTQDEGGVIVNFMPGNNLTVNGTTTINNTGSLILKSDATGSASFIENGTITGAGSSNITVEQYVTDGQWHLVSSPVANATVNSLYFNGSPEVWLKEHNEPDDTWEYITSLSTLMPFGKGFGYWVGTSKTDVTALFEGDLLTDDLTLNSGSTPPLAFTDIDHGFNLVGNPYSSALDWDIGTWERTNLEGSVWVWLDAGAGDGSGNYLVRNLASEGSLTDGIIPMCQGFFVRSTTSAPVLTIPEDARVSSSQPYYKDGEKDVAPHIILNVSNNENQDEVWIGFDEDMTTGMDYGRDVSKLFGSNNVPQLYLVEQDNQLSIDILPELVDGEERTVTMGFAAATQGTYNLTASSLECLPETDIILEDLKTWVLHDLHINPEYSFTATSNDDPDRFLVHFFYLPTGINNPVDEKNNNGITIYSYDKAVYIKCYDETATQKGTIEIWDIYGRLLISKNINPCSLNKIYVPVSSSYVMVRVVKDGVVTVGKVFVH